MLKERVGSVRSQAAARYDVSPAEIVAAARFPNPDPKQGKIDENAVAKVLAAAAGAPYLKIDPLAVDNDLVAKTLSRPFAHRHVVIPIARERDAIALAVTDPFDTALRDSLEQLIQAPLRYVVSAKCDIIAIIDRVYGFRSKVSQAQAQLGRGATRRRARAARRAAQQRRARRHHATTSTWSPRSTTCSTTPSSSAPRTSTSSRAPRTR